MVMSGWQIYDASPIFTALQFPPAVTLGGWLGGALLWHFAVMWLLVANFLVYLGLNIASGRLRRKLLPLSIRSLAADTLAALRGRLTHADLSRYNAVQKLAYLVRDRRHRAAGALRAGHLEIGAVSAAAHLDGRL